MTASDFATMDAATVIETLCPRGEPVAGVVETEQDWDNESTTLTFEDGSKLRVSGPLVELVSVPGFSVGDRVEGGEPGTEDYDTGKIWRIVDAETVHVGWDSLQSCDTPISVLRVI